MRRSPKVVVSCRVNTNVSAKDLGIDNQQSARITYCSASPKDDILELEVKLYPLPMIPRALDGLSVNLLEGIIANLITAALLVVIPYSIYLAYLISRQRDLDLLFGLRNREAAVAIRTSRVELSPGEPFGTESVQRGYIGAALLRPDYLAGALVANLLHHRPLLLFSVAKKRRFSGKRIAARLVTVTLDASPPQNDVADLEPNASLVLVGGPIYNPLVRRLMGSGELFFQLSRNPDTGERTFYPDPSLGLASVPLPKGRVPEVSQTQEIAIVERQWDTVNQRAIIALYGLGSRATAVASHLLVNQFSPLAELTRVTGGYESSWAVMITLRTATADVPDEESINSIGVGKIESVITPTTVFTPPEPTANVADVIDHFYRARRRVVHLKGEV